MKSFMACLGLGVLSLLPALAFADCKQNTDHFWRNLPQVEKFTIAKIRYGLTTELGNRGIKVKSIDLNLQRSLQTSYNKSIYMSYSGESRIVTSTGTVLSINFGLENRAATLIITSKAEEKFDKEGNSACVNYVAPDFNFFLKNKNSQHKIFALVMNDITYLEQNQIYVTDDDMDNLQPLSTDAKESTEEILPPNK